MNKKSMKGWLYLLPAILFLGCFMVYPLIDVVIYSWPWACTIIPTCCATPTFCRR